MGELPIFYSFRRCPYAMRARLGLASSQTQVELREVILRDKPEAMLEASPKGTVPVLILQDGQVIDESFDIMQWALKRNDPNGLYDYDESKLEAIYSLIKQSDGPFKSALDAYKYPNKFEGTDRIQSRQAGADFIMQLDEQLGRSTYLFGENFSLADAAILPFIRQFAHVDQDWFYAQEWKNVITWLDDFKQSERFLSIMTKYDQWEEGSEKVIFGA